MQEPASEQELKERLTLIENMITEGRRQTESWGWSFILWGLAFYVAIAWSAWAPNAWAWPVTMVAAIVVSFAVASLKAGSQPRTSLNRALASIWIALGVSAFLLFLALGLSGRLTDAHVFVAVISAILGMANGASALILRWKAQLACAVVWWAAAVAGCFGTQAQSTIVFLAAIFLCQILFGAYGVAIEAHKRRGPAHA